MTEILIESVDVVLCEDGKTVMAFGYGADDSIYVQSVTSPMRIDEDAFLGDDWLGAFSREGWRQAA